MDYSEDMAKFLIRSAIAGLALWLCSVLLSGIHAPVAQSEWQFIGYLFGAGVIFTLVTMLVRPVVVLFSIPLYILTLGLFSLVVNALMLMLSSWLADQVGWGLHVDGFWWAVLGGLLISIVFMVVDLLLPKELRR